MIRESRQIVDPIQLAEMERLQMSCELHDGVLQYLISAKMLVEAIEYSTSTPDPRLSLLRETLERGVREGREWIGRLRGDELQAEQPLSHALESICESFAAALAESGTRFQFEIDKRLDGLQLDDLVRTAIFRIVQESLRNAKLHAEASAITCCLCCSNTEVKLAVTDNGKGFEVDKLPAGHYGVLGMMARARLTGGNLQIRSSLGTGTTIEAAWTVG